MPGPPKDVPADELFLQLCAAPSPNKTYLFPRKGVEREIRIFVLDVEDHLEVRLEAQEHLKGKKKYSAAELDGVNLREVYGDLVARFILMRAVRAVDPIKGSEAVEGGPHYPYLFPTLDSFKKAKVSSDELAVLFSMYQMTQAAFGPYEHNIENEQQLSAWIERLVVGASAAPLARCDWRALVESNMLLARRAFLLSAALESQRSSLPPTLVSLLEGLGHGTSSFGELPAKLIQSGLDGDGDWLLTGEELLDGVVADHLDDDIRRAARFAENMHKRGE